MAIRNSLIGAKDATQIYKDFDLSFARNLNTNDVARKVDVQAVKQSLKNLLRTQLKVFLSTARSQGLKFNWLRGTDLNRRPSGYEPDELPDCSTPRYT